jgi:hypothetical protein
MDTGLQIIVAALAELTDTELHALIDATNRSPQTAPGLMAWIEAACDWELNRRRGYDYPLQLGDAAFLPEEDAVRIGAAIGMRSTFPQDRPAPAVLALLHAIVELLTGIGRKP